MYETLSRGKRTDNGEWIEGYHVPLGDKLHYILTGKLTIIKLVPTFEHFPVDPKTIGQYTGLTDRNGKKIFVGDIIDNDWCFIYRPSVVMLGEYTQPNDDIHTKHIGFFVKHTGTRKDYYRKDLGYYAGKCEVLGNIHDNPELLGGDPA